MPEAAAQYPVGTVLLLAWLATIGWIDLRTRRIPNDFLMAMAVATISLTALRGVGLVGATGLEAAKGAGMAAALFLPSYAFRGLGAGDAKLGILIGTLMGSGQILNAMLISGVALGIAALIAYGWGIHRGKRFRFPAALPLSIGVAVVLICPSWVGVGG